MYEKCNESRHAGKPVSADGRRARVHHQQGCRHYRGLQGGAAGSVHADTRRVRGPPFHMGEGSPGSTELQHRPQAGYLHRGGLQT